MSLTSLSDLTVPEWNKVPEQYRYMMDNTAKMCALLEKHALSDKVKAYVHRDHHGLYIQFEWHNPADTAMPDFWSYNIFQDRRETWRCNGFTIYTAEKQYYGKQFINMIMTREHYAQLERQKQALKAEQAQQH